jgi:molybdate transport system substrate-binding protein
MLKSLFCGVLIALSLGLSSNARAQNEVTLLSPNPIQQTMDKLVAGFQAKTGISVKVTYGSGLSTRKQVAGGQALDVSILFAPFPEALTTGNIVLGSATVIARLRLGIAVKKGAPKPDISTPEAVKNALLSAKSIAAIDPAQGTAGAITLAALDDLGITDEVKTRMIWVRGAAAVQESVVKGESEIALGPYTSEMDDPGIDIVGALPTEVSMPVDITGFLSTSAKDSKAARMLLDYLASHEVAPVYQQGRIFPVR